MTPIVKVLLGLIIFATLGYGAYTLGRSLSPEARAELQGGTALQTPVDVSYISLTQVEEGELTLATFQGKLVVVFFGFTRCPDVCPPTLSRLAKVYQDLGEPDDLAIMMISVDPEHDTPELVQRYVSGFHPDFIGLSGSASRIAEAAKTFYIGYQQTDSQTFIHTDAVIVLDRQGQMRRVYGQNSLASLEPDLSVMLEQTGF